MAWGNEPRQRHAGRDRSRRTSIRWTTSGWAVILTYVDDGHVDDSDAAEIDYDDMLKDMKEGTEEQQRGAQAGGLPGRAPLGWAEKPHYDAAAKKLYWAKELNFEGSELHTLNYDVRVLGREGVLSMNAVATHGPAGADPPRHAAADRGGRVQRRSSLRRVQLEDRPPGGVRPRRADRRRALPPSSACSPSWSRCCWHSRSSSSSASSPLGGLVAKLFGKKKDAAA